MITHPSENIPSEIVETLREQALSAEQNKSLTPGQLALIRNQRWFDLFVPEHRGGLGKNFPEAVRLLEAIAWADGSTGWTVTLCSGAGWFIGFLNPASADKIFHDPLHCIAGSGKNTGEARLVQDGYEISGTWSHATGAPYATVFTFNCMTDNELRSFWVPRNHVTIRENWDAMGMVATASHSFELSRVFVPAENSFSIDPFSVYLDDIIFQFPFQQFAEATLAANISGMAMRFLELCASSDRPKRILPEAIKTLQSARNVFYQCVEESWAELATTRQLSEGRAASLTLSCKELAAVSRSVVNDIFPLCGLIVAQRTTEVNRVWRNLQTASLHVLLT
ncbi:hypothetical protein [Flavihumibacter solisilvae]|uniref:hypothetical protein n=1 Tax=Flavihumibacter solisilvae TaxID=1349421 RepID=UPI00068D8282|nr:hypothetical protein [Flavihumibacter solisilvae]